MRALPLRTACLSMLSTLFLAYKPADNSWVPLKNRTTTSTLQQNRNDKTYVEAITKTMGMVSDPTAQKLIQHHGLNIVNITWEDTGRYKNSSVGPNISDMSIQVEYENPGKESRPQVALMPVIRYPNFTDKTGDIDPRAFTLLVGNQNGRALKRVSLYDFLKEPTRYLSDSSSWRGKNRSLLASKRDDKVLVSAQACFLPVPKKQNAQFNPVLFNYQSVSGDPAVLTILATREGTSVTIIDNKRDRFKSGDTWGQRLFHNDNGQRASLTGERLSDYKSMPGEIVPTDANKALGMSMVLVIQIPLKQRHPLENEMLGGEFSAVPMSPSASKMATRSRSDIEAAVIGHGVPEGPFTEIDDLAIERDERFPIRVTVQFYKATTNGMIDPQNVKQIAHEIESVYQQAENVGSLVVAGETGRPTEYEGNKLQPADWWETFWKRYETNIGESRHDAIKRLIQLIGSDYQNRRVSELYLRDLLHAHP